MPQDEWEKYVVKSPEASSGDEWEQYVVATEEPPVEEAPIDGGGLQKATSTPAAEAAALKQTKGLGTVTTKREVTADVSGNNPSDNGILAVTNPVKTSVKGTTEKQVMIDAADQEIQNQIVAEKVSRDPVYIKGLQKLQANPADPKGHYEVGIGYLNQGGMSGATKAFESAIELNPKDADALMGAGYVKSHSGDHEGALQDYMSAVNNDQGNPALYNNIAYELNALGKTEEAKKYIQAAILLNPDIGNFYTNKSQIERSLGNDEQAEKDIAKAKEKDLLARDAPTMEEKWASDPDAQQLRTMGDWVDAFSKGEGGMFFLNPLGGYLSRSIDLTTAGIQNINRAADMQAAYLSPTVIDQRNTDVPVLDESKVTAADKAKKTQQYATSYLKGLQGLSEIAFGATMVTPKVNPYLPSVEGMVPFTVAAEAATIPFPDAVHMAMAPVTAGVNSYYKSKGEPVPEWMSSLSATGDIALVMAAVMGAERLATVGLKAKTDLEKIKEKLAKQEPLTNDEVYQVSSWIRENTDSFASAIAENLAKIPDDVTPAQRVEILPEVIEINGLSKRLEKLKASTNSDKAGLFEELHNKEIQELSAEIQARKKKIYDIIGRADELKGSDAPSGKTDTPVEPSPEPVVNNTPAKVEKPSRPIEEITADVEKSKTEVIPGLIDEIDLLPEGVEKVDLITQLALNNKERIKNEAEKPATPVLPAIIATPENKDDNAEEVKPLKEGEVLAEFARDGKEGIVTLSEAIKGQLSMESGGPDKPFGVNVWTDENGVIKYVGNNAKRFKGLTGSIFAFDIDGNLLVDKSIIKSPEALKAVESLLTKKQQKEEEVEGLNISKFKNGDIIKSVYSGLEYEVVEANKRGMAKLKNLKTGKTEPWNADNNPHFVKAVSNDKPTKSLEETFQEMAVSGNSKAIEDIAFKNGIHGRRGEMFKQLSDLYTKAKADGSNPELVKAVEQSLKETTKAETINTPNEEVGSVGVGGDVEGTAKALEEVAKTKPTLWEKIKEAVKNVGKKLGIISNADHINNFNTAKAEWDKLSSREKKLKRADYELDDLHHTEGGYYKVGNSLIDLDLNSNHLKLLLENNKFLNVLNKLGVTKIHGENRPAEEMFAHYSDGKIHLNNNSAFENIRQVTNAMSHELGHHEWTKLTKEERDYVRSLPLETGMAKHYEAQEKSGKGKETSASLQEENFADYVMQYFQGKLYGDEALLNKIPTKLRELFDNKYSDLLKDNEHSEIAEAYHKAKADGSNPELVKAVESLLTKDQPKATKEEATKEYTPEQSKKRFGVASKIKIGPGMTEVDMIKVLANGTYQREIAEGRMTADEAKRIIEAEGITVPKDILDLVEKPAAGKEAGVEKPITKKELKKERDALLSGLLKRTPVSAREAILQYFAGGGKISTDDIMRELGLKSRPKAARGYIWAHTKKAPGIDRLVMDLAEELSVQSGLEIAEDDLKNEIIDVLNTNTGRNSIIAELGKIADKEKFDALDRDAEAEAYFTPEQIEEIGEKNVIEQHERTEKFIESLTPEEIAQIHKELEPYKKEDGTYDLDRVDAALNEFPPEFSVEIFDKVRTFVEDANARKQKQEEGSRSATQSTQPKETAESKGKDTGTKETVRTREQLTKELESAKEGLATAESNYNKAKNALDKNLKDKQGGLFTGGNEQKLFDDTAEIKAQAESAKKKFDAAKEKADNLQKLVDDNIEGQQEINEVNEAKNEYGKKEITVEGQKVSYQSAFNFGDQPSRSNVQRKSDSPKSDSNKLKPGEFQSVEAVWSKDRNLQFSGTLKVESHKDVAHIMRLLETASVEHAFAIHIDKDGNSHIQFLSIGGRTGTVVDPRTVLAGVSNFKSKKVYLVHNHPSGSLKPSDQDIAISKQIFFGLNKLGIDGEHIIMDTFTGEYTLIENDLTTLQFSRDKPKDPDAELVVHKLDMMKILSKPTTVIGSPHAAAGAIQAIQYSALPKSAMLVVGQNNSVLANFILDSANLKNITDKFSKIPNAAGVILYGNTEFNQRQIAELSAHLGQFSIRLLDVMKIDPSQDIANSYISAIDLGFLNEVQEKYGTGEVNDPGTEKGSGHYDDSIPSKPSADGKLNPIDLPELIQIAKEISGGKIPGIKTMVTSLGYFNSKLKEIMLNRDLFDAKNYDDLIKVLAHELGHFIDFIPDETLKRGNILGRIASLKDFMGKYLPFKPGDPGELTKEDIKRIRAEVKKAQQPITKVIDEEITKTIGITPQDVLDVWNSTVAGHNNPQLLDFIKTLSDADKKSIVKDAIKGILPDMLKHLQTVIKEKTGKKITITEYPDLAKAIRDAIIDEVKKRKLWVDSEVYNEAYNLSKEWRPFDEKNTTPSFLKYRKSGKEVYADMISILFNSPGHLEAKAPKFFEAFMNYLDAKPEFKAVYEDVMELMTDEARLQQERLSNTKSNYEAAREKRREIQQKEKARRSAKKVWDTFQQQFISISSAVLKKLPNDKAGARLSTKERVRNSIEQMFMWKSKTALLMDEYKKVTDQLVDNGIAIDDVGAIVESIRNLSPTRADKANPLGFQLEEHNLDRVQKVLDEYSVEQQELIGKVLIDFYEINFNVMQDAYDAGLISADLWQEVQKNKYNYATFKPIKYIDEKIQTAKIFAVTGTLEGIANPFDETMVKTAFIQRAAERNKAIIETLEALEKHSPGTVVKTEYDNGKPKGALKPGEKYVHYRRGGKAAVFITDADIANIFEFVEPQELSLLVKTLNILSAPLKAAFTKYNPGFVFYNNLIKDGRRSLSNVISILSASNELKSLNYISLFTEYAKSFVTSVKDAKSVLNKTPTGIAKRMLLHGAINPESAIFSDHNPELSSMANIFSHHENMQEHLGLAQKKQSIWEMAREALLFDLETFIAQPGRVLELTNKIAGYKILEKRLGAETAAYYTRNVVGTPNYSEKKECHVSFIPFAKVIMQGLRNDVDLMTGKKTAKSYWLFKGLTVLIPALLTLAASKGLFDSEDDEEGQKLSDWFAKLSKYQRLNTGNIPLGFTDDGKARGLTIPMDDISKLQYALIMEMFEEEDAKDKARTMFQQVVQSTPLPNFANGYSLYQHWYTFLAEGQNPYDNFYKKDIISQRNFELGETAALSDMGKYTLNTFGLRLPDKEMGEKTTTKEKLLSLPLINRIYKETSSGDYEYLRQTKKEVKKENAQRLQRLDDTIEQILETEVDGAISDKKYNPSTVHTLANKAFEQYKKEHPQAEKKDREYIISKIKLLSQRQLVKHLPVANAILGAESKAEKKAIMEEFKSRVSKQDYIDLLRVLDNADIRPE
jgi:hypothetical protein